MADDLEKTGSDDSDNPPANAGDAAATNVAAGGTAGGGAAGPTASVANPSTGTSSPADSIEQRANVAMDDVQVLLTQAQRSMASVPQEEPAENATKFEFRNLTGTPPSNRQATLDLLQEVELELEIELGKANMTLEEVLQLHNGSVVALNKLAGDPVDVIVNGRLIARGEVLVMNDNFCVRVAELVSGDDLD